MGEVFILLWWARGRALSVWLDFLGACFCFIDQLLIKRVCLRRWLDPKFFVKHCHTALIRRRHTGSIAQPCLGQHQGAISRFRLLPPRDPPFRPLSRLAPAAGLNQSIQQPLHTILKNGLQPLLFQQHPLVIESRQETIFIDGDDRYELIGGRCGINYLL